MSIGTAELKPIADFYHYPDTGCKEASRVIGRQSYCLRCPFPECIEVNGRPNGWSSYSLKKKAKRNKLICQIHSNGASLSEIVKQFQISQRTVSRILAQGVS